MLYKQFVERVIAQDSRNVFLEYSGNLDECDCLAEFYRYYNPVDAEFELEGATIRLFSIEELPIIKEEYSYLEPDVVFASCNGDPIFIRSGNVFTCPHGVKAPKLEKLGDSFADYLNKIISKI